jgi:hypothetical protein
MHCASPQRGRGVIARLARYAWAGPNTLAGLFVGGLVLLAGGRVGIEEGVVEFSGGALARLARSLPARLRFGAITLGHTILGVSAAALAAARRHEHVHVRQYERWGPLFLPAYVCASAWALAQGRRCYRDNHFEREAYAAEAAAE